MAAARNYRRQLYMLYQEDPGFGADDDKKPEGFLKFEVKGSTGMLTSLVQNLKDLREEGLVYKGFIGSTDGSLFVSTGTIPVDGRGRGESRWRFDPEDIAGTGYGINKFNVFGVMVFGNGEEEMVCPLAGHTGNLIKDWKRLLGKKGAKAGKSTEAEAVAQISTKTLEQQGNMAKKTKPGHHRHSGSESFIEEMLKFCPGIQPFCQSDPNCRWWRINSYNYLFGIMFDDSGEIRYYIYGIPGVYNTQAHMQMEAYGFCKWHPQRGEGHRPGDCGYWLAFVDSKTGTLANPDP